MLCYCIRMETPYVSPPIPVPTLGQVVRCVKCQRDMVIDNIYIQWKGHPGYCHSPGHPNCVTGA